MDIVSVTFHINLNETINKIFAERSIKVTVYHLIKYLCQYPIFLFHLSSQFFYRNLIPNKECDAVTVIDESVSTRHYGSNLVQKHKEDLYFNRSLPPKHPRPLPTDTTTRSGTST